MQRLIVTENPEKWTLNVEGVQIVSPSDYINDEEYAKQKNVKVINLCKSYQYQSEGYYISLLAEARGHKSLPVTSTLMDFKLPNLAREDAQDFDKLIQDVLDVATKEDKIEFNIYLGTNNNQALSRISQLMFNLFQMPIQKASFIKKDKWQLQSLKPLNLKDLSDAEREELMESLKLFLTGKKIVRKNYKRKKYDLAILVNQDDPNPPSDSKALQKFVKAADKVGFSTEFITKADYGKLTQFDALFIRETTNVNHHTFRFARRAEYEGLAVIDDSNSILKCTNKVYLNELLAANNIPTPKSVIIQKNRHEAIDLEFPYVLKQPDGAFSKGVKKVKNKEEQETLLKEFFQQTELMIAQEFMPTSFDWRVGILGGEVIYVCKYFMAKNHWQIIDWKSKNKDRLGDSETFPVHMAPKNLIAISLKATKLIGNGLYGVDVKEVDGKFYIVEINDNPSIESGIEDEVDNMDLYEKIMSHMMKIVLSH
ncbi:RimK family protein [Ekhidna sp.]|uniref:RimK family protein n=1 Tax=Ekhidna sp. TaxID=2608089 RepID=UPI0032EC5D0B